MIFYFTRMFSDRKKSGRDAVIIYYCRTTSFQILRDALYALRVRPLTEKKKKKTKPVDVIIL